MTIKSTERAQTSVSTMFQRQFATKLFVGITLIPLIACGCGGGGVKPNPAALPADTKSSTPAADGGKEAGQTSTSKPKPKFEAVELGGGATSASSGKTTAGLSEKQQMESVVSAMQPLQVMLGKWRGTTNKEFKGFKKVEELEWIWDFRTSRAQPALTVKSDKSPYISEGRMTYLPEKELFQFTATTPEGTQHVMTGTFVSEPEEFTGDDNKPQKKYKLSLAEADTDHDEAWQVDFDQQENNRYLVKVFRKRGGGKFQLVDTVGTQRQGTSVAANDEDYGEKKCIISGGLGTMTVSYNGKSYYVCCTGC